MEYGHAEGHSVAGGQVYRGNLLPSLRGNYFYGDSVTAFIRSFRMEGGAAIDGRDWSEELEPVCGCGRHIDSITTFGRDGSGELCLRDQDGEVFKIASREGAIVSGDYDGDQSSDIAVFGGTTGLWAVRGENPDLLWRQFRSPGLRRLRGERDIGNSRLPTGRGTLGGTGD